MGRDQVGVDGAAAVAVRDVVCRFGSLAAVDDVSLEVEQGQFLSLLGPSGCGKTTLLRIVAGLQRQTSGTVEVAGRDVSRVPAHKRPVGLVFQRYALFPHKTVAENVAFSLMLQRRPKDEIARRVDAMLELVRLGGFGHRRIDSLSGGQAQRVALARALVSDPPVLLLDEPLAALDLKLRQAMHVELREIQRRVGSTFVYVTHDQEEALVLSDRVVLMSNGRVVQDGPPRDVYQRPRTLFAATFLGEANLFEAADVTRDGDRVLAEAGGIRFAMRSGGGTPDGARTVCLRPERIVVSAAGGGAATDVNVAAGTVERVTFLGPLVRYAVRVGDREVLVERPAGEGAPPHDEGDAVELRWDDEAAVLVAADA